MDPDRGPVPGEDGLPRCPWAGTSPSRLRDYHDREWGHRVHGEAAYLERLTLEAFQSGLSWSTILHKREAFRAAFAGFEADRVAAYDEHDVERLMVNVGIVRNRRKIAAAVTNAQATVDLRRAEGLEALVLSFAPDRSPSPRTVGEVPITSAESAALSRELKRRGFVFVGPTTMHALIEATGLVDPHLVGCHRRSGDERGVS